MEMRRTCLLLLLWAAFVVAAPAPPRGKRSALKTGDKNGWGLDTNKTVWFVQLSDIHLSAHGWAERETDLISFAKNVLPLVRPSAIMVSGDLVDGKTKSRRGSRQYDAEWQSYERVSKALLEGSALPSSHLVEVRGNHDSFDVPARGHSGDFFGRFTATGRRNATELAPRVVVGSALRVGIVGVELSNSPGFNRPCNFRGQATPENVGALRESLRAATAEGAKATVVFGHFPLSVVADRFRVQRELSAAGASAYLNGHLHDRLGDRVHAWHRPALALPAAGGPSSANTTAGAATGTGTGNVPLEKRSGAFLELETADWKDIRRWRLLAVDSVAGNALSFTDLTFVHGSEETTPIVLITSPADARYDTGDRGANPPPAQVRALVFHREDRGAVQASLMCGPDELATAALKRAQDGGPLYSAPAAENKFALSVLPVESFALRCPHPGGLVLRVTARVGSGPEVVSERPVAPGAKAPRDLGVTPVEWATLSLNVGLFATGAFWLAWGFTFFVFVLLPRALARRGFGRDLSCPPPAPAPAHATGAGAGVGASPAPAPRPSQYFVVRVVRFWLGALGLYGSKTRAWRVSSGYIGYLAVGPWLAGNFLTGSPPGFLFGTGILFRNPQRGVWEYKSTLDAIMVTGPHLALTVLPLMLWVVGSLGYLGVGVAGPRGGSLKGSTGAVVEGVIKAVRRWPAAAVGSALVLAVLALEAVNTAGMLREAYGPWAVVAGPGVAWTLPLAGWCLMLSLGDDITDRAWTTADHKAK